MTWLTLAVALATGVPDVDPAELVPVAVPEPSPLAMDYYRSGVWIWFFVQAWGLIVPAVILFSGLSGRMRDLARRIVAPFLRSGPSARGLAPERSEGACPPPGARVGAEEGGQAPVAADRSQSPIPT